MSDLFLITSGTTDFVIPKTYSSLGLAIEITPLANVSNWYKVGYLKTLLPFGSKWLPITNKSIVLTWQQIIEIQYDEYRLSFAPVSYLPDCNLIVTPYNLQYNPMSIYNPNSPSPLTTGGDSKTAVASSITNVVALAANTRRAPDGMIVNNATKNMWVTFDGAAAVVGSPSLLVPANGGELDIPGSYTGAINAIWETGATGGAVIHEFTYQ